MQNEVLFLITTISAYALIGIILGLINFFYDPDVKTIRELFSYLTLIGFLWPLLYGHLFLDMLEKKLGPKINNLLDIKIKK